MVDTGTRDAIAEQVESAMERWQVSEGNAVRLVDRYADVLAVAFEEGTTDYRDLARIVVEEFRSEAHRSYGSLAA